MIGRAHRFHGYGSLKGVYQRGQTARSSQLSLRYAPRDPKRPYRVAVVVSKKIHKSAVKRNRIRRRIYEAVRHSDESITPGTDLVFTVQDAGVAEIPAAELQETVAKLLEKAAGAPSKRP